MIPEKDQVVATEQSTCFRMVEQDEPEGAGLVERQKLEYALTSWLLLFQYHFWFKLAEL